MDDIDNCSRYKKSNAPPSMMRKKHFWRFEWHEQMPSPNSHTEEDKLSTTSILKPWWICRFCEDLPRIICSTCGYVITWMDRNRTKEPRDALWIASIDDVMIIDFNPDGENSAFSFWNNFDSFLNLTDSDDVQNWKHDAQNISTDDGMMSYFNWHDEPTHRSIRINFESFLSRIDSRDMQSAKHHCQRVSTSDGMMSNINRHW
jgi:hypothetical protein